jgi:hypothetical protein
VVECVGLENRYTRKGIEGSNPSLSARKCSESQGLESQDPAFVSGTERTETNPDGTTPMQAGCKQDASDALLNGVPKALLLSWPNLPEHVRIAILALVGPYLPRGNGH